MQSRLRELEALRGVTKAVSDMLEEGLPAEESRRLLEVCVAYLVGREIDRHREEIEQLGQRH